MEVTVVTVGMEVVPLEQATQATEAPVVMVAMEAMLLKSPTRVAVTPAKRNMPRAVAVMAVMVEMVVMVALLLDLAQGVTGEMAVTEEMEEILPQLKQSNPASTHAVRYSE
jgi:hypothetical protein